MDVFTIDDLTALGYVGVAIIVFLESAGLPLPGGTALAAAGLLAADHRLSILAILIIGLTAAVLGGIVGYLIGVRFGVRFLSAPGPLAGHRARALVAGRAAFGRYGSVVVLLSRFLPAVREAAPVLAGSFGMTWKRYLAWTSMGATAWVCAYSLLGFFAGASAGPILGSAILVFAKIATTLLIAGGFYWRRRSARHGSRL